MSTELINETRSNDDEQEQAMTTAGEVRRARIARDGDGRRLGAPLWLSDHDLRALGVEPDSDTDAVEYSVRDGRVRITRAKPNRKVVA